MNAAFVRTRLWWLYLRVPKGAEQVLDIHAHKVRPLGRHTQGRRALGA